MGAHQLEKIPRRVDQQIERYIQCAIIHLGIKEMES